MVRSWPLGDPSRRRNGCVAKKKIGPSLQEEKKLGRNGRATPRIEFHNVSLGNERKKERRRDIKKKERERRRDRKKRKEGEIERKRKRYKKEKETKRKEEG